MDALEHRRKIIFVAACVAIVSMFMKWVDVGIASRTGLTQATVLLLGLYVYPVLMLFKNNSIKRVWGLVCSITAVVLTLWYINSQSVEFLGEKISAVGPGAWLFFLASIALIVGVIKYKATISSEDQAEADAGGDEFSTKSNS